MKQTLKRLLSLLLVLVLLLGVLPTALAEGAEPTNVALGKTVTDGGKGSNDGTYWHTSFLTDGENHDLSGGNNVGWSSVDPIDQDQDVELTINLAGSYDVSKISILPTAFDSAKFFPTAYTVSVSADGEEWTEVATDTFETIPAVEAQEYTFETKTASYVRVTITEHRFADNKYVSQLGEIEVYGVEHVEPAPELENVALSKSVSDGGKGSNDGTYWHTSFLTDGQNHDLSGGNNVGWSSKDPVEQYEEINLTVDLDGYYDLSKIVLLPTAFDAAKFYPTAYTISVSADGEEWEEVASDTHETIPAVEPQEYTFETKTASHVRVTITENRAADGKYMSQLGEIEAYGVLGEAPETEPDPEPTPDPEDVNLALTATQVYATSSMSGGGLYDPNYLKDGKYGNYPAEQQLGWNTTEDAEVTVQLAAPSILSSVKLVPITFESGKFFPTAYTVYVSEDGNDWEEVASASDIPDSERSTAKEHTLDSVKASFVKVAVKTRSVLEANGTTSVYAQFSELEIYGHAAPKELTLLSASKPVSATSNHYESFFNASFLTDGIWKTYNEDGNTTLGWCSMPGDETPIDVTINLQTMGSVEKIVLKPQKWSEGKAFPKDYELQVSTDGQTWTTVATGNDVDTSAADNASVQPLTYEFEAEEAAFARIHITEHSDVVDTGTGARYSAIGEFEVWGEELSLEAGDNVAIGQKVTADNYFEEPDSTQHYSVLWLVDGKYTDGSKYGYSTKKGITSATDSPANIIVELEGVYDVSRVTVVPVQADGGIFFPEDYAIQLSEDGEKWTDLVSVTGAETGINARNHDADSAIRAKYVRLQLTKHRYATGSYRGQAETLWASRISELEVYGEVVKLDQPHINKTGLQMNATSTDQLSVGWRVGEPLDNVTWESDDTSVVTVDENGAVAAVANGTATITGTYPAGENYDAGTVTCEVEISDYRAVDNLMITTFWPMIRENMNQEYVDDIAEAGFTNIQLQYSLDVANYDDNMTIIGMAQNAGIGVTVNEKAWGWGQIANWSDEDITAAAMKYSHIPGVVGYFLIDEPAFSSQPAFYHCFKAFKDAMPEADVHFNFLPDRTGMRELMESEAAPYVDYLMWDAYIYGNSGVADATLFNCSNATRELGLKYGIKTAQYIQSVGFNNARRRPDGDEIRYNVNGALAYGNKQIAYFTYRRPEGVTESFTDAIVKEDGTRTDLFDAVKDVNNKALAVGPVLMTVEAAEVYHTGAESGANNPLPEDYFLQPVSTSDRGLIVSYMRNLDTKQNYSMLVNRDYDNTVTVTLNASEAAGDLYYVSQEDGSLVALTGTTVELEAGGFILIKTAEDYDYMPNYGEFVETPAGENAATGKDTVVSASGSNPSQLIDGARISNTYTDGCGLPGYTASVGNGHTINLDFGGQQTLNRVDLYPGAADKFPTSFVLEGSADGEEWVTLAEETEYTLPENLACSLPFESGKYQYLRLTVNATASGELQICELEAYNDDGTVPALRNLNGAIAVDKNLQPADNMARTASVSFSSNHGGGAPYWTTDKINDGVGYDAIGRSNAGWSSAPDGQVATDSEWVSFDLGTTKSVNKVIVFNAWHDRGDKKAECYPSDYMIQVSMDGEDWETVYAVYNDTNWMEVGARVFEFEVVNARYVRFFGERLGRCGEGFCLQLSEIEIYGGDPVAEPVDTTELEAAIEEAEALNEEDYTPETWAALEEALEAAKTLGENATQEEVDAAAKALNDAMDALVEKADKSELEAAIEEAEALNEDDYTAESWAVLEAALEDAKAICDDENASQANVDAAAETLNDAIDALEEKEDEPVRPPVSPNPGHPSLPGSNSGVEAPAAFPFGDVPANAWFYDEVKLAWEKDLIDGMTADKFDPNGSLTRAQAIKLAASLHQLYFKGEVTLTNGAPNWFDSYVDYAVANGIIEAKYDGYSLAEMNAPVSREEFVHIFHGAMPSRTYNAINDVAKNAIPDVKAEDAYADEIYTFYRAGILNGSDAAGSFYPDSNIKRSEVAAILIRMFDADVRVSITLN